MASENNLNIILNDSFSGSTICNTVREILTVESSFVSRIDKYITEKVFTENKINTMFIFGGTNEKGITEEEYKKQAEAITPAMIVEEIRKAKDLTFHEIHYIGDC